MAAVPDIDKIGQFLNVLRPRFEDYINLKNMGYRDMKSIEKIKIVVVPRSRVPP